MNTSSRHSHGSTKRTAAIRLTAVITTVALMVATFFIARYVGTERGRDDARHEIMQNDNISAGPGNIIPN